MVHRMDRFMDWCGCMDREPLHNKIIREIIAMIVSGTFSVGQRLPPERALCEQFDVSRGTLRKALSQLAGLGVVDIRPGSGVYVCGVAPADLPGTYLPPDFEHVKLDDIIEARKAIETAAVESACRRITAKQLKGLGAMVERMARSLDNLSEFLECDLAFHQGIVRAGGNAVLAAAFEAIYDYHRFSSIYTSQDEGEEAAALEHHRRLLDALARRDQRAGRKILTEHLDSMKKYTSKHRPAGRKTAPAAEARAEHEEKQ